MTCKSLAHCIILLALSTLAYDLYKTWMQLAQHLHLTLSWLVHDLLWLVFDLLMNFTGLGHKLQGTCKSIKNKWQITFEAYMRPVQGLQKSCTKLAS